MNEIIHFLWFNSTPTSKLDFERKESVMECTIALNKLTNNDIPILS